ncbi:hypothetical protein VTP01DRAFT_9601 [Rhizomucor pusillus]|uniref:uncharacterized protein n=1 Tax=Rhizomucor pusillus TaxID=4840 RepID=UPI00374258E9
MLLRSIAYKSTALFRAPYAQCRHWDRHSWIRCYVTESRKKYNVLFFGTDDFAVTHLKALVTEKGKENSCINSIDLVCPPDRWTGRKNKIHTPSPTKGLAELYSLPVFHTPEAAKTLDDWHIPSEKQYDLGIVVSFGYFIPPRIIQQFKYGAINVHPSLLPKYRGAAPIQHTILAGDDETGVTVQELHPEKFDAGRILNQKIVNIREHAPRYRTLKDQLAGVGSRLLVDTLQNLDHCKANAKVQDESQASTAPKIKKEWSIIDWDEMEAWQVEQLHRAIGDQYPLRTTFTFSRIKRSKKIKQRHLTMQLLNIYLPKKSPLLTLSPPPEPGTFAYDQATKSLHVCCADLNPIALTHIKAEDSGVIDARDFKNGYEIRDNVGQFGYIAEDQVAPGMSGVRVTKRREEYNKTIRRRMKMRKAEFEAVFNKTLDSRSMH